jgi:hypothetical protein
LLLKVLRWRRGWLPMAAGCPGGLDLMRIVWLPSAVAAMRRRRLCDAGLQNAWLKERIRTKAPHVRYERRE